MLLVGLSLLIVTALGLVVFARAVKRAPKGFEDKAGFHHTIGSVQEGATATETEERRVRASRPA